MPGILYTIEAVDRTSEVLEGIGHSFLGLSSRVDDALTSIKNNLGALGMASMAMGGAMLLGLGQSAHMAARLEQAMAQAATVSTASGEEISKMTTHLEKNTAKLGMSALNATEAYYEWSSAGYDVQQQMEGLVPTLKLARISKLNVADAVSITTDVLKQFNINVSETDEVINSMVRVVSTAKMRFDDLRNTLKYMGPVAASAGWKFEETAKLIGIAANQGIRASKAGTSLRRMLQNLMAPTAETARMMEKYNINVWKSAENASQLRDELARNSKEMNRYKSTINRAEEALWNLQTQSKQLSLEQSKARLRIMKIRQRARNQNRKLTESEKKRIESLKASMKDIRVEMMENNIARKQHNLTQRKAEKQLKKTKEESDKLRESLKGMELKGVEDFINELYTSLKDVHGQEKKMALRTMMGVRAVTLFTGILNEASNAEEKNLTLLELFDNKLDKLSRGLEGALNRVLGTTIGRFRKFKSSLSNVLREIGGGFLPALTLIFTGLSSVLNKTNKVLEVLGPIPTVLASLTAVLMITIPIVNALGISVSGLAVSLAGLMTTIAPIVAVVGVLMVIWKYFHEEIIEIAKTVADKLTPAFNFLKGVVKGLMKVIMPVVKLLAGVLVGVIYVTAQSIYYLALGLWKGLKPAIAVVYQAIKPLIQATVSFFEELIGGIEKQNQFVNLMSKLQEGMKAIKPVLVKVGEVLGTTFVDIFNTIKSLVDLAGEAANAIGSLVSATKGIGSVGDWNIPFLQEGGYIEQEGIAYLHAGEMVVPSDGAATATTIEKKTSKRGGDTIINGDITIKADDPDEFRRKLQNVTKEDKNRLPGG